MNLPRPYAWLLAEPGPRLLCELLKLYGTTETPGSKDNQTILSWAKSIGLERIYKHDAMPWCGLVMAYATAQAGWDHAPCGNALAALNWAFWGHKAPKPMLGDIMVFKRKGGGHVGLYVGEDASAYHILGGNQSDQVNIKRVLKSRLVAARRCPWRISQPANVRKIWLTAIGTISTNEA